MNQEFYTIAISLISLSVAIFALYLNYRNHRVSRKSYFINRELMRNGNLHLDFVKSTQLEDRYVVHLVVFNPSQIGLLLHSLAVFEIVENRSWINDLLNKREWVELTKAKWWPTTNLDDFNIKSRADEYKNVYVENSRDIYVSIPGFMPRTKHKFEIVTNLGGYAHIGSVDSTRSYFSHSFQQFWHEK
ncbi:hypothetical protein MTR11_23655 [Vibrio sp. CCB-PB317]|uniref:hypothetical protein n=1 Tax=Vibrio sp. CCB-PB317 TaxID=2929171 RepID=UPI001A1899A5|nr:hypothetical protein [Vibrio sp. CCB-PB317]EGR3000234.1 hypothetical protein [Vibrio parahaemolyticus]EHH2570978.1 hypothetical protein [Vibrio parahaemolyticus]MCJ0884660.1 hypothetical protein [Vibrio sp. CCB-PB317]HAS8201361.1 hypothetical protein [Vibrio vulnificus]